MGTGEGGNFGNTKGSQQSHADYISKELPKGSPINIPSTATVKEENKNGYDQVKYSWKRGDFSYTSRCGIQEHQTHPRNKAIAGLFSGIKTA